MHAAYVDTSCIVALALGERGAVGIGRRLASVDQLLSSNLLQAELEAALVRERVSPDPDRLPRIRWVLPDRPLTNEIRRVLDAGYVRGADCWHLATALFVARDPSRLLFLTLDVQQRDVAKSLGFSV